MIYFKIKLEKNFLSNIVLFLFWIFICNTFFTQEIAASSLSDMDEIFLDTADGIIYTRTLSKGMSGNDVYAAQELLYDLGYLTVSPDGIFGSYTETAVKNYQAAKGLENPDGMIGRWTISQFNLENHESTPADKLDVPQIVSEEEIVYTRNLYIGTYGEDVFAVQRRLYELGYLTVTPDGIFGEFTKAAVIAFQSANGLSVPDGIVGTWTISKLNQDTINETENVQSERHLLKDMYGEDVYAMQERLYELGFLTVAPDGYFGNYTLTAVNLFQKACGLSEPDGIVGNWTKQWLQDINAPRLTVSSLAQSSFFTEKNFSRENKNIQFIIIHHMAGRLTGAACANYFVWNDVGTSAHYCIGYEGDIASNVPENFGAYTSGSSEADKRGITIEVSDTADGDWRIPDAAQNALVQLCADIIRRNPQMGSKMIFDPEDEARVLAAKNGTGSWDSVKGNVLIHRWTSITGTGCPEWHMVEILPSLCERVNALLQ